MGLLDFFKKNKNVISDDGYNLIYHNNGKGFLMEKFQKKNGILTGQYFKYDSNGKCISQEYYDKGNLISQEEQNRIIEEQNRIKDEQKKAEFNDYKLTICVLLEIDKLISEIADGNIIVQMKNSKLIELAEIFKNKLSRIYDENLIQYYLFYKRNYLINQIVFKDYEDVNLNYLFTDYILSIINNVEININNMGNKSTHFQKTNSDAGIIFSSISAELLKDNRLDNLIRQPRLQTSITVIPSYFMEDSQNLLNQECLILGIKLQGYYFINKRIEQIRNYICEKYQDKYGTNKDIINVEIKKIKDELLQLCNNFKCNQHEINLTNITFDVDNINIYENNRNNNINEQNILDDKKNMSIESILSLSPNSNCIFYHEIYENWEGCYWQYNENKIENIGIVVNEFNEKYNESGWGDFEQNNESKFNPFIKVHEGDLEIVMKRKYTSTTFIKLIQEKIIEFQNVENGLELEDFIDWLNIFPSHTGFEDLCEKIGCKDFNCVEEIEDNSILWYSYYELESQSQKIWIEVI